MIYNSLDDSHEPNKIENEQNLIEKEFSNQLKKFCKDIRHFNKHEKNIDNEQKEKFFQEKFLENKFITEKLQKQQDSQKLRSLNKIIDKFLKSQAFFEKIYEDFLMQSRAPTEKINQKLDELEITHLIEEIQILKQSDNFNIEISFFRRILKAIENIIDSLDFSKNNSDLQQIKTLIMEANELEKKAFAFELSELGVLRDSNKKKEEIIEQLSRVISEKEEIMIKIQKENDDFKQRFSENAKMNERITRENEQLLKEINILREVSAENKENIENQNLKTQKKLEEEKNRKIFKTKAKNKELKESLRTIQEQILIKSEENKIIQKELRDLKSKSENEINMLSLQISACQGEKYQFVFVFLIIMCLSKLLKQKLEDVAIQNYKTNQVYYLFQIIFKLFFFKFEKIEKELKNAQFLIDKSQEEKATLEKNLKKMQNNEEKLLQDLNKIKESYFYLEEQKKNDDFQHNSVILSNLL